MDRRSFLKGVAAAPVAASVASLGIAAPVEGGDELVELICEDFRGGLEAAGEDWNRQHCPTCSEWHSLCREAGFGA
jgi:anaerobic selenocysteine-containing dehydrogenase